MVMSRRHGIGRHRNHTGGTTIRIIGGDWRGRRITVGASGGLRPTPDRVRETLFNWLAPRIVGARCFDLFAGTGALGLEALSRGAAQVDFVERDHTTAQTLRQTLKTLGGEARARVVEADARNAEYQGAAADIVFIDPPFTDSLHAAALAAIGGILKPDTRLYLEYPTEQSAAIEALLGSGFHVLRRRRAAAVGFCLAQLAPDGEDSAS